MSAFYELDLLPEDWARVAAMASHRALETAFRDGE
jgi:hypothetical protein